jgi:diguanylate cyclase
MEAAARPEWGQQRNAGGTPPRGKPDGTESEHRLADLRVDSGLVEAESIRNTVPRDRALWLFSYIGVVILVAAAVVAPSFREIPDSVPLDDAEMWLIAAFAVLVDARPFATPGRIRAATVFPSIAFTFALLLGWGLAVAVTVQAAAVVVSSFRLRHAPWRALFNVSQYALSFAAAALVLNLAGVPHLAEDTLVSRPTGWDVVWILAAGLAWFAVNHLLVATALFFRFNGGWARTLARSVRQDSLWTLSLLALGPLVMAAGNVSAFLVPLMLVPLVSVEELARFTTEEHRKATVDELTGLPNRKALYAHMRAESLAYAERTARMRGGRSRLAQTDLRRMALLLLDIDQFRRVNDALGHAVGDRLLEAVAARLREAIGADGVVARLGGDEFAVLAPRLADAEAAGVLAERVADALALPVTLDGLPLDVTAAIGVAVYPDHGTDNTTLLRHAEVAMYDAKDLGSTFAIYSPEADQNSPERLELLADLRRALENGANELQLFYQPQIEMATGEVVGTEALLRWNHPERGFVSPELLIKVAEQTAVMQLITSRVMEDAVAQLAQWKAHGVILRTSINVSARDLHRPEFVDELADLLVNRGVAPNQVQLEITEGALMADPRRVLVTLHRLDKLGVALSLDDFGTGYSSLQHLRRLPLAEVKIDRSFVLGMTTDPDDAAVVNSIIDLARALGLRVVAEGVEDEETRRFLVAAGCEVGQGWLFARPMPADALKAWLGRYRPPARL